MESNSLAVAVILHDDDYYLEDTLRAIQSGVTDLANAHERPLDAFAFVSRMPYFGTAGDWKRAIHTAQQAGFTVVEGDWDSEPQQRKAAQAHLLTKGYTHALIPDGDEIIEPQLLKTLLQIAQHRLAERVYVHWDTYFKSPEYVIRPRESFAPCYLIDLRAIEVVGIRDYRGGRALVLGPEYGLVHHLSWVGPQARITRKYQGWAHAPEVIEGWHERVWKGWDHNHALTNLHPTHPAAYGFAERIPVPQILLPAWQRFQELAGAQEVDLLPPRPLAPVLPFPRVSVVIPVHGGTRDLEACLTSLAPLHSEGLIHQVLVVDDATGPEEKEAIAQVAKAFPFTTLLVQPEHGGFSATCNAGAAAATGELLLFLNADTVVPREGYLRLVEALASAAPLVAAAGPFTNRAGHLQQIDVTYTQTHTMPLFAQDFAHQNEEDAPDRDVDMLVGFCFLVRAPVFGALGGFDTRFGIGTYEDNDLCYQLRRQGYRLLLAGRAFVHHSGSTTLTRVATDVGKLLARNHTLYLEKWQEDLTSGYASHLAGLAPDATARIVFDPARSPQERLRRIRKLARQADITLAMIVKNEERVLGAALASAMPFFNETIVVDTGSTDRTAQIATSAGAKLSVFPWTNSFSDARNESLRQATGRWVFWMDADDTLTLDAGEAILQCALSAAPEVVAFVVPVQFVDIIGDDGTLTPGGTRVDHVKLFRRLEGIAFEGRIHEQILPSLRRAAGEGAQIARAPQAAVVLHSGYDTSAAGQAKKRERDAKLLEMDLKERPNHPFVLFNLGMTDHYGGEHAGATLWLQRCIDSSGEGESHVRKAYALLAVSQRELGHPEEALQTLRQGIAQVGDDPELHFQAGYTLAARGEWAQARSHYEKAIGGDVSGHFSSIDVGILGYKTCHNLGQVCLQMQDYRAAKSWWQRALTEAPDFMPSLFALFDAALVHKELDLGHSLIQKLFLREGASQNWAQLVSQHAEAVGGSANAHQTLRAALERHPDSVGVGLVLARRLLNEGEGKPGEATALLEWLEAAGVAEAAFFLGVMANQRGDHSRALAFMERSLELNPGHGETKAQVARLKELLLDASKPATDPSAPPSKRAPRGRKKPRTDAT
jgi:GT2 family glycosyltransferase/tetratricopeptide (TPR) repeat protein